MTMTEAGHRRAAAGVEIAPPLGIDEVDAVSLESELRRAAEVAMQDRGHVRPGIWL